VLSLQFLGEDELDILEFDWEVSKVSTKNVSCKSRICVISSDLSLDGVH